MYPSHLVVIFTHKCKNSKNRYVPTFFSNFERAQNAQFCPYITFYILSFTKSPCSDPKLNHPVGICITRDKGYNI